MSESATGHERVPDEEHDERYAEHAEHAAGRPRRRGYAGCLAVLVALAVLAGLAWFAVSKGTEMLDKVLDSSSGEDYPGPGTGKVLFEVEEGDSVAQIGRNLKADGVVASVDAWLSAANADDRSQGIQVGFYQLKKEMPAEDALEILVEPDNLMLAQVTIPEGLRVTDILDQLAEQTEFERAAFKKVLAKPASIGLPDYANGNPEGYLFPSTYDVGPKDGPRQILKRMVDRWRQAADDADLEQRAAELGKTPAELMIIASLVEAEGRGDDMPKVARVIYNRLDGPGDKGGTNGLLQVDASNAYGIGKSGTTALTEEELAVDTPYNTRLYPGLPPTPIEAPGEAAIDAAANPADGPWYYYVTVNLRTGETKFYEDYEGFLQGKAEYEEYCATKSDRC